jgi:LCP family protein required for cell wall assembly
MTGIGAARHVARAATALLAIAVLSASWVGLGLWRAWGSVDRVAFDPSTARETLGVLAEQEGEPAGSGAAAPVPIPEPAAAPPPAEAWPAGLADEARRTFLVIGSDLEEGMTSERADVIVLVILPGDGGPPVMVSLPRDLYLPNPCTREPSRINANLNGCGDAATGPELLAIAVEDFTGIPVDHFIAFRVDGFIEVIDRLGGMEVCLDHAVRDGPGMPVLLPEGCTRADGEQMLAWVRSRHTQELIDGEWRTVPGVNDLHRKVGTVMVTAGGRLRSGVTTPFASARCWSRLRNSPFEAPWRASTARGDNTGAA